MLRVEINLIFTGTTHSNSDSENQQLAEEWHKPVIRKSVKCKIYLPFKNNFWTADVADMQLISKCNKVVGHLLCVIDTYSKNAWVILLIER